MQAAGVLRFRRGARAHRLKNRGRDWTIFDALDASHAVMHAKVREQVAAARDVAGIEYIVYRPAPKEFGEARGKILRLAPCPWAQRASITPLRNSERPSKGQIPSPMPGRSRSFSTPQSRSLPLLPCLIQAPSRRTAAPFQGRTRTCAKSFPAVGLSRHGPGSMTKRGICFRRRRSGSAGSPR